MTRGTAPPPSGEASELLLIRLKPDAGPAAHARIEARLSAWGAETVFSASWGWLARLPQSTKAILSADRDVATVGGVQPTARHIRRIRVPVSDV